MALDSIDLVKRFGVKADGQDYTGELQSAADLAYRSIRAGNHCDIWLPPFSLRHSETWVVRGNQGGAPAIRGNRGDAFSVQGSRLWWAGAANGVQVFCESFNRGRIWDVAIDGMDIAGRTLWIGASKWGVPEERMATSGASVRNCHLSRVKPGVVGNGALTLGTDPALIGGATFQCSEWSVRDCVIMAESGGAAGFTYPGMKAWGFKTLSAGNCKNGEILNTDFITCNAAIDWAESSGYLNVQSVRFADVRRAVLANSGHLNVVGGDAECGHVDDFRLLAGTSQANSYANISDMEVTWNVFPNVAPILLDYGGGLSLRRNIFGYADRRSPFRMIHSALAPGTWGSLVSEQNAYRGCGSDRPYIPLYDSNGNDLAPVPMTYGGSTRLAVSSTMDTGSGSDGAPIWLKPFNSSNQG